MVPDGAVCSGGEHFIGIKNGNIEKHGEICGRVY